MKWPVDYADIFMVAPCVLGYLWTAGKFCKTYLGTSRKKEHLFLFLSCFIWLFLNMAVRRHPVPYIVSAAAHHIFFAGLVWALFRAEWEKKVLAASMLMTAQALAVNFCGSFLSCLALVWQHTAKRIPDPVIDGWAAIVIVCASYILAILAVRGTAKHFALVFSGKPRKWYVLLAIPLLAILAVVDVANWGAANGVMVRGGKNTGLYRDQIFSHAGICVLTGISVFAIGFYVFGMAQIYLEQEKNGRYYAQIAAYKLSAEQHRQAERLRHDMKNHIIALSGLFRSEEWEKLGDYLTKMEESCLEPGGDVTGNRAVDALLHQKRSRAKSASVRWECDVQIPRACGIQEFDLCVLFGNILDNALEACERLHALDGRFISVQAKTVKKCFLIEAKNSMDRTQRPKTGRASQESPKGHGIGLQNVRDVVRRYHGAVNSEAQNGIYIISILIPLQDTAHDIERAV